MQERKVQTITHALIKISKNCKNQINMGPFFNHEKVPFASNFIVEVVFLMLEINPPKIN